MVRNKRHIFQRKAMRASSPSSSTSSVYTSADDAHRCIGYERSQFLDLEDIGTAWLLGSHSSRDRSKRVLERFKIDNFTWESTSASIRKAKVATMHYPKVLRSATLMVGIDFCHTVCHVIT